MARVAAHSLVDPAIDRQPVDLRRLGHELPEPSRARDRVRRGVEAALDHRHVDEVLRERAAAQRPPHRVAPAAGVSIEVREGAPASGVVAEELEVLHHPLVPAHRDVGQREAGEPREVPFDLGGGWGSQARRRGEPKRGRSPVAATRDGPRGSPGRARGRSGGHELPGAGDAGGKSSCSASRSALSSGSSRRPRRRRRRSVSPAMARRATASMRRGAPVWDVTAGSGRPAGRDAPGAARPAGSAANALVREQSEDAADTGGHAARTTHRHREKPSHGISARRVNPGRPPSRLSGGEGQSSIETALPMLPLTRCVDRRLASVRACAQMNAKACPQCKVRYPGSATFCFLDGAALVQASDPMVGRTIAGRYVIEGQLGEGGMATVYRAKHTLVDRPCAVKFMNPMFARDPTTRERFRREARSAQALAHPNVIEIFDQGETEEGRDYIVMELLSGSTLGALIEKGPVPVARAVPILIQMARGIARAHDLGVVHRDLKPDNIFLCPRRRSRRPGEDPRLRHRAPAGRHPPHRRGRALRDAAVPGSRAHHAGRDGAERRPLRARRDLLRGAHRTPADRGERRDDVPGAPREGQAAAGEDLRLEAARRPRLARRAAAREGPARPPRRRAPRREGPRRDRAVARRAGPGGGRAGPGEPAAPGAHPPLGGGGAVAEPRHPVRADAHPRLSRQSAARAGEEPRGAARPRARAHRGMRGRPR